MNIASIESGGASSGGTSTSTIALDATSTSITTGYAGGPVTKTWTHTVSGTNPVIVLSASIWQDVAGTGSVTSASWNGGAFVKATSTRSGGMQSEIWYLIATTTGAKTMSVTVTGATDAIKLGATSFSGVSPSSPLNTSNAAIGTSGNPAVSLASLATGEVAVATLSRFSTTDATTSKSALYKDRTGSILGAASYSIATSSGSYTDTYTGSANQDWSMSILSLRPATTSVAGTGSTTVRYFFTDHLGGTAVVADQNAAIVESIDYTPFGATRLDMKVGSYGGEKRKFAQTEFDSLSQLNYMMARYESGVRGQFISQDPVFWSNKQNLANPQSLNGYSYASNNPINASDPTGKITEAQNKQLESTKQQLLQIQSALSSLQGQGSLSQSILRSTQSAINSAGSIVQQVSTGQANSFGAMSGSTPAYSWSGDPAAKYGNTMMAAGIPFALALPTGGLLLGGAVAPTVTARAAPTLARIGPFVESLGVNSTLAEYRASAEVAEYAKVPFGFEDVPWSLIRSGIGKAVGFGAGAASVAEILYYSFTDHEKLNQIQ